MEGVGPGTMLGGRYTAVTRVAVADGVERWRGEEPELARDVSILCLPADDPRAAAVLDAARVAAGLDISACLRILDIGIEGQVAYLVEESLGSSPSVTDLVRSGGLPGDEVRRIAGEVATALEAARARGVHHLRLSPDDVFRTAEGTIKVRGLATAAALARVEEGGERAARTDAVGIIALMYAGLTGLWPHPDVPAGLDPAPVAFGGIAAPSEIAAGVPTDLDALCRVALAGRGGPTSPGDFARQVAPWSSRQIIGKPTTLRPGVLPESSSAPSAAVGSSASGASGSAAANSSAAGLPGSTGSPAAAGASGATAAIAAAVGATAAAATSGTTPPSTTVPRADLPTVPRAALPTDASSPSAATGSAPAASSAPSAGAIVGYPLSNRPQRSSAAGSAPATTPGGPAMPGAVAAPVTARPVAARATAPSSPQAATNRPATSRPATSRPATSTARPSGQAPTAPSAAGSPAPTASTGQAPHPPARPEPPIPGVPAEPLSRNDSRLALGIVVGFVVLALIVGINGVRKIGSHTDLEFGSGATAVASSSAAAAPAAGPKALAVLSADGFDPLGDNSENGQLASKVFDGNPDTEWASEGYQTPNLGGLKPGAGVILDLGPNVTPKVVKLHLKSPADVTVLVAQNRALDGAETAGSLTGADGDVQVDVPADAGPRQYVIVWFTNLSRDGDGFFRARLGEVTVLG